MVCPPLRLVLILEENEIQMLQDTTHHALRGHPGTRGLNKTQVYHRPISTGYSYRFVLISFKFVFACIHLGKEKGKEQEEEEREQCYKKFVHIHRQNVIELIDRHFEFF